MKPKDDGFHRLSQDAGILAGRVRFLGWNRDDVGITRAIQLITQAQEELFLVSVGIQEKADIRPLFDRPGPRPVAPSPPADSPPLSNSPTADSAELLTGIFFEAAEQSRRLREGRADGSVLSSTTPASTPDSSQVALRRDDDPEPPIHSFPPRTKLFVCNRCNGPRTRDIAVCPVCYCNEYRLAVALEGGILGKDEEFLAATAPATKAPKTRSKKKKVDPGPPPDWEDPDGAIDAHLARLEASNPPLNCYDVYLPEEGDGLPRSFLGNVHAASITEAIAQAPARFERDIRPGTAIEVIPGKGFLDGMFTEVSECATCGKRWPKKESVGCPVCVHAPVEPMPEPPQSGPEEGPSKYFLVSAKKGNPLYCLTASSLAEVTAFVNRNHVQDWDGTYREITPAEWVRLPSWLTTRPGLLAEPPEDTTETRPDGAPSSPPSPASTPGKAPGRGQGGSRRKGTYRLVLNHPDHDDPIVMGEVKASGFDEARDLLAAESRKQIIRLDTGKTLKIDPADVELVQVPTPRKAKEAARA